MYKIIYDKNKNYNMQNPPYRSEEYKSIYEGITIEMHIVDHCNLNCANCNHFAPLANNWFINLKDFEAQIQELKNNIPNVKRLILLGGEPTLHPDLLSICKIARNLYPDIPIEILSNGIFVTKILEQEKDFKPLNISFRFCSYPGYTNYKDISKIDLNTEYFNTRNIS